MNLPKCNLENIPAELARAGLFCLWRYENVDGQENRKVPYNPKTGARAQANNKATFSDVQTAARNSAGYTGLGVGIFDNLAAIDIDHCIGQDGKLSPAAADIIDRIQSYTEISPSGTGVRVFFYAAGIKAVYTKESYGKKYYFKSSPKAPGLEIYISGMTSRYVTITGNVLRALPVAERSQQIQAILDEYMPKQERAQRQAPAPQPVIDLSDVDLIRKAMEGNVYVSGSKFKSLWEGDISQYENDESKADYALCSLLAYWTGGDAGRVEALFGRSGLRREKWDRRRDYRERTIKRAIAGRHIFYDPADEGLVGSAADFDDGWTDTEEKAPEELLGEVLQESAINCLSDFLGNIEKSKTTQAIPTGFYDLDSLLDGGLYAGLYFVGAISSLGKTTFCLQIADSIAKSGHDVLIFSLEMARDELMAKSISRLTYAMQRGRKDNRLAKTTRSILNGAKHKYWDEEEKAVFDKAVQNYGEYADRIYITVGVGDVGVRQIRKKVERHIKATGNTPVVIIDYIQILAPVDPKATDKQATDKNVLELKRLSRDYSLPVLGISSFNRDNYSAPVNMASFKESGAIEYSSDVLIGLQYNGMDYQDGEADKAREKRVRTLIKDAERDAKLGRSQLIDVKILKNRNGSKGTVNLNFTPMFNCFTDAARFEDLPEEWAAEDDWTTSESTYK